MHKVELDDDDDKESAQHYKRRRSSSTGERIKMVETFTKTLKDNHIQKMHMLQQAVESSNKPQSELELYFSSICKTVEKLPPLEQAKLKMQISNIVCQAELSQLQSVAPYSFNPTQIHPPVSYAPPNQPTYLPPTSQATTHPATYAPSVTYASTYTEQSQSQTETSYNTQTQNNTYLNL